MTDENAEGVGTPAEDPAEASKPAEPKKEPKKKEEKNLDHILIRPWPKMVVLYPMFILSILFGILNIRNDVPTEWGYTLAMVYLCAFGANIFVMAFEFNRIKSIAIFFLLLAFIFLSLFLSEKDIPVLAWISGAFHIIKPWANSEFYFFMGGLLFVMFLVMFIHTRLDYWEVTHNELLHHHGIMGNVERFPAPNLRITKEINDVVEFLLLFSGTLVLFPASEARTIVLENVPRINRVERDLQTLLSKLAVEIKTR